MVYALGLALQAPGNFASTPTTVATNLHIAVVWRKVYDLPARENARSCGGAACARATQRSLRRLAAGTPVEAYRQLFKAEQLRTLASTSRAR
jgi:hypothetical protein